MKGFENLEFKLKHAEQTLVFEKIGNPEKEREFELRSLRDWGFDLLLVWNRGRLTYLLQEEGLRKKGESFTHEEEEYTVEEVLQELPKDTSIFAKVEEREGRAYILVEVRHVKKKWGEGSLILNVPAAELLIAFFRKKGLDRLYNYVESVGITTEFFAQRGQPTKPLPYSKLPAGAKDYIRRIKEIFDLVGFGRMSLAYYGKTKDKDNRFRTFVTLPTVDLFDLWIAEKLNNTFRIFK